MFLDFICFYILISKFSYYSYSNGNKFNIRFKSPKYSPSYFVIKIVSIFTSSIYFYLYMLTDPVKIIYINF